MWIMGRGRPATVRRLPVPVLPAVEEALAHPEKFDLQGVSQGQAVARLAALGAQQMKRARAEREDRELYERYRDDPERRMVAPVLVQLAREGGVI